MRLQVNVSDDMAKRIDMLAERYGVSRSALCSMFIGQCVDNAEMAQKTILESAVNVFGNMTR